MQPPLTPTPTPTRPISITSDTICDQICEMKRKNQKFTRDELDFWSLEAFESWVVACVVAA